MLVVTADRVSLPVCQYTAIGDLLACMASIRLHAFVLHSSVRTDRAQANSTKLPYLDIWVSLSSG